MRTRQPAFIVSTPNWTSVNVHKNKTLVIVLWLKEGQCDGLFIHLVCIKKILEKPFENIYFEQVQTWQKQLL
jgi:hypothetical protein